MRTKTLIPLCAALALSAACKNKKGSGPGAQTAGAPVETRVPNAPEQKPAFPGQTRAPFRTANVEHAVRTVAKGLSHPWALAFLPDGALLVTERPGRMRIVASDGTLSEPVAGLPAVDAREQGGLLDVVLDPQFATSSLVYWSYSEPREGGNGTTVARAKLQRDGAAARLEDVQIVWRNRPTLDSTGHFGSRLVFTPDGDLFITTGERLVIEGRMQAQKLDSAFGKVIRVRPDGQIPQDNPLVGKPNALPEIYSWGHRNVQAAALHPQSGKLWIVDHGPKGGDEINVVAPGNDYGWPTITYGIDYSGEPIGEGITQAPGMAQPIYYWDPVIAPSGMAFYEGAMFPAWRGSLFVGGLASKHLARLTLDGERVVGEERLLVDRARIRDVRVAPDGSLFVVTDEDDGGILQIVAGERRPTTTGAL